MPKQCSNKVNVPVDLDTGDFIEGLLKLSNAQIFSIIKKLDVEIYDDTFRRKLVKYFNSKYGDLGE